MGLVDDQVLPAHLLQPSLSQPQALVARHHHVELPPSYRPQSRLPLLLGGLQLQGTQGRQPLVEFAHPIAQRDFGGDDDVRPGNALALLKERQHSDGLDGLAQTHIICQNAADTAFVQTYHPVQRDQLVVLQLSAL